MRVDPRHLVDVFVYVVVLNLAAQLTPHVITENFAVSLLTAVLLKLVVEVMTRVKTSVLGRLRGASRTVDRVTSVMMLVLILPGSKFVLLWLEDMLFGDAVSLGGFWSVTALVLVLTAARWAVRALLRPRPPS